MNLFLKDRKNSEEKKIKIKNFHPCLSWPLFFHIVIMHPKKYLRLALPFPLQFSFCNVFFVSKGKLVRLLFYFTDAGGQCCVAVVECLLIHVLYQSADYIFISFGITEPIVVSLKMEVLLM